MAPKYFSIVIGTQAILLGDNGKLQPADPDPLNRNQHFTFDDASYITNKALQPPAKQNVFDVTSTINSVNASVGVYFKNVPPSLNQQWTKTPDPANPGGFAYLQSKMKPNFYALGFSGNRVVTVPKGSAPSAKLLEVPEDVSVKLTNKTQGIITIYYESAAGRRQKVGTLNANSPKTTFLAAPGSKLVFDTGKRVVPPSIISADNLDQDITEFIEKADIGKPLLSYVSLTPTTIQLTWEPPQVGAKDVAGYIVERIAPAPVQTSAVLGKDPRTQNTTVVPNTIYKYTVTATNAIGAKGATSDVLTFFIPAPTAPHLDHSFEGESVSLRWTNSFSSDPTLKISNFRLVKVSPQPLEVEYFSESTFKKTFSPALNVEFQYYVVAITSTGVESPRSAIDKFTIKPSPPVLGELQLEFLQQDVVKFSWPAATFPYSGVTYTLTQLEPEVKVVYEGKDLSRTVNVPRPLHYKFVLVGKNENGNSKPSDNVTFVVEDPTVPLAAPLVTHSRNADGSFLLEWENPAAPGSIQDLAAGTPLSGITEWHIQEEGSSAPPQVVPVEVTSLIVNVPPKSSKRFTVTPITKLGVKAASAVTTLSYDEPPQPTIKQGPILNGSTTITVTPDPTFTGTYKDIYLHLYSPVRSNFVQKYPNNTFTIPVSTVGTYSLYAYVSSTQDLYSPRSMYSFQFKGNKNLDILFLVDCTGSMGPLLTAVQEKIDAIIAAIPDAKYRLAFVGYRDYGDTSRLEKLDFTTDVALFRKTIRGTSAQGGGKGVAEDVAIGMNAATNLSWNPSENSRHIVIHIGDAPAHGKKYGSTSDEYAYGDPEFRVPENDLITLVKEKDVRYFFMKLTPLTDTMIEVFQRAIAKEGGVPITVLPISADGSDFLPNGLSAVFAALAFKKR